MRLEIKDTELCPCGSGKKYQKCCKKKAFKFVRDEDGQTYKRMPVAGDLPEYLQGAVGISSRKEMLTKFMDIDAKQMEDAQFIDVPYLPEAKFSTEGLETVEIMKRANVPSELIYAFQKTGLVITKDNRRFIPDVEIQEFNNAIDEYLEKYKKPD